VRRILPRLTLAAALAVAAVPFLGAGANAQPARPCIPSYTGNGPKVTVDVDYDHPLNSQAGYDTSDFSIQFDLCLH
jgi:hypothetical protein